MPESHAGPGVRAAYEASTHGMAVSASRAYLRALAERQAAALAGDLDATRDIRESHALFALAAPEVVELQHADPGARRMHAHRSIA